MIDHDPRPRCIHGPLAHLAHFKTHANVRTKRTRSFASRSCATGVSHFILTLFCPSWLLYSSVFDADTFSVTAIRFRAYCACNQSLNRPFKASRTVLLLITTQGLGASMGRWLTSHTSKQMQTFERNVRDRLQVVLAQQGYHIAF